MLLPGVPGFDATQNVFVGDLIQSAPNSQLSVSQIVRRILMDAR
jgi:hypothetical protein